MSLLKKNIIAREYLAIQQDPVTQLDAWAFSQERVATCYKRLLSSQDT